MYLFFSSLMTYICNLVNVDFSAFHFESALAEGLESMGFREPTPIQQQAIPYILAGKDLIACAQTGTGKTAAFLLPVMNKIAKNGHGGINTLIIVPTRELAQQIDEAIQGFAYFTSVSSIAVYGGNDGIMFGQEKKAFKEGVDIIVGTPGRLLSHLQQGYLNLDTLQHLILDEADRMLDMGFSDDIQKMVQYIPHHPQTLLFSATMPHRIRDLAKKILREPEQINIALSKPAAGVTQGAYVVYDAQKMPLLLHVLAEKALPSMLIFSSTKEKVKMLELELKRKKFNVAAIHSDLDQPTRKLVLRNFAHRDVPILVATDILSRGIDVDEIGLVINYDVPGDAEDYVHRVGRTARAATTGEAITFLGVHDQRKFYRIEQLIEAEVPKLPVPPEFGETPAYAPQHKSPHTGHKSSGKGNFHRRKPKK